MFLDARYTLSPSLFDDFVEWIKKQLRVQAPELVTTPVQYDELWGVYVDAPPLSLENEIRWATSRLSADRAVINRYLIGKKQIEKAIFQNRIEDAIVEQDVLFKQLGASMGGIQLRIALENLAGGIDRQKLYSSEIRGIYKGGLLGFIGFYASMRNEQQSNLSSYINSVTTRINQHPRFESCIKHYLLFHLTLERSSEETDLADILKIEQSHSIIDVYETYLTIVQTLVVSDESSNLISVINECLLKLEGIEDYRVAKLVELASGTIPDPNHWRDASSTNALLSGQIQPPLKRYHRSIRNGESIDPWLMIYAGFAYSQFGRKHKELAHPIEVPYLLGRLFAVCQNTPDAIGSLSKLLLNFRGIPALDGLAYLIRFHLGNSDIRVITPLGICLNSPDWGEEDNSFNQNSKGLSDLTCQAWSLFYRKSPAKQYVPDIANPHLALFEVMYRLNQRDFVEAAGLLKWYFSQPRPIQSFATVLWLKALIGNDDRPCVIEYMASEAIKGGIKRQLTPPDYALEGYSKYDYSSVDGLSGLVALHLLWEELPTTTNASNLRLSIRQTLKRLGASRPSKLSQLSLDIPNEQMVYFLSQVCKPVFIDQIRSIDNTLDLIQERQDICYILCSIDPDNEKTYQEEIADIEYRKTLEEGAWIVDRTRIHVDTDALNRWCFDNLSEDFTRYRSLIDLTTTAENSLANFLKDILSGKMEDTQMEFVQKTEADQLLLMMIIDISDQFLANPVFGLDFHLSKRIRHQSFVGLIRGPAEAHGLITTKSSSNGEYHSNKEFLKSFDRADQKTREAIDKAFRLFSRNFDDRLIEAKDYYFQIHSSKKYPKGLINLKFSNAHIRLMQELTKGDETLADFVDSIEGVFWGLLEPSLKEARRFITEDLTLSLRKCFDELRGQVSRRVDNDSPAYLIFSNSLSASYQEVIDKLEQACGWFTRLSDSQVFRAYKLEEMIHIAVNSALKPYQTMSPEIEIVITDNETTMDASNTVLIHDVIFVALGNIYKHSGLKNPRIKVAASVNTDDETFTISVENNLHFNVRRTSEPRLRDIKEQISLKDYGDRTRKENRSGLLKLAAVANQNSKGRVEADFIDDEHFRMTAVYQLIIKSTPQEEVSES